MDANGTRYQLLLGYNDWASCTLPDGASLKNSWEASPPHLTNVFWDKQRNELTLRPKLLAILPSIEKRLDVGARRGAARDRYGNWYWIDPDRRSILVNSSGTGSTSHFWSVGDGLLPVHHAPRPGDFQRIEAAPAPVPITLSSLAVTSDHYLVVGVLEPQGLLRFDLHAGGPPQQLNWPKEISFVPFDMAPSPCGGVWILDRHNQRYWALNRHFQVIPDDQAVAVTGTRPDDFQATSGGKVRGGASQAFPEGISLPLSSPLSLSDPVAIEGLPDGTVLILDSPAGELFSTISRYRFGRVLGRAVSTDTMKELIEDEEHDKFELSGYDFAFVPEHSDASGQTVPDRLYVASANGKQSFAFNLSQAGDQLTLDPLPDFYPMHQFGGKALIASSTDVSYDFADRWIPLIAQKRPRYEIQAAIFTLRFDGHEPNCVWHRLMLDACLPAESEIEVWTRASDSFDQVLRSDWRKEPDLYRRSDGSELPFVPKPTPGNAPLATWELLFQHTRGRYLQIQLRLTASGRVTPRLFALRAWYPRFSYLNHYLPAVYRDNTESASFLDRFLANPEGIYTSLEDKIAAVQALFDVRSAPVETLDWLASWLGVVLDPAWDELRRRMFIQHAMEFFQFRGTIRGMKWALRLAIEDCADASMFSESGTERPDSIRIVEKYLLRQTPGVVFGDPSAGPGLQPVKAGERWLPTQGGSALHDRYRKALNLTPPEKYPLNPPSNPTLREAWTQFSGNTLGFVPSTDPGLVPLWQAFLERRYGNVKALNTAWLLGSSSALTDFKEAVIPMQLPPDGAALLDWYQFQSVTLPTRQMAHRFSILLPAPKSDTFTEDEHQRRLALAHRVADLEKPAHTVYDIKFYWAMFRLGDSRLGPDTLLDLGSRSPQLMPPLRLGQDYLAESYLAPNYPQDVAERQIIGRERLNQASTSSQEKTQ